MDTTGKEKGGNKILIYGASWCPDCKRVKKFFGQQRIPYENVDIVEFMPEVKASRILQEKVSRRGDMNVKVNHAVKEFLTNGKLESVVVEDRQTGELKEWSYDAVFVFVGVKPNSSLARERAQLDENGFVITDRTLMTFTPGLFAAGDVRSGSTKQAAAAAGEGATVAVMIRSYLEETD